MSQGCRGKIDRRNKWCYVMKWKRNGKMNWESTEGIGCMRTNGGNKMKVKEERKSEVWEDDLNNIYLDKVKII